MSVKNVFKCRMPSMNYVFSNGKYAQFVEGVFMTDIESEIAELQKECKSGHPHIYIDKDEETFDTSLQDSINKAMAEAKLKVLKDHEEASKTEGNESGQESMSAATLTNLTESKEASAVSGLAIKLPSKI